MDEEIRVWRISKYAQKMEASLKEHRNRVWNIIVNSRNDRATSASVMVPVLNGILIIIQELLVCLRQLCLNN